MYKYMDANICISPEIINPVPIAFFQTHTPDTNIKTAYKTKPGVA